MPYRIDLKAAHAGDFERLVDIGALDVETAGDGSIAAIIPDDVAPEALLVALGHSDFTRSAALGRDDGSVWVVAPRPVRLAGLDILPAGTESIPASLTLIDGRAFGTGLHPTTALCIEIISNIATTERPASLLDIGCGSGVLALAALRFGVPRAVAIDLDDAAIEAATENARRNGLAGRVEIRRAGPDAIRGQWPLVVANILAAPLIEMAPSIVRLVSSRGALALSGIPSSVRQDVERAYQRQGLQRRRVETRDGWVVIVLSASW